MQNRKKRITHQASRKTSLSGLLFALIALAGIAPAAQAAHSQKYYANTGNQYQSVGFPFQNRFAHHRYEENRVRVVIPMHGVYFDHRKTLKLKSLIKDYSRFRPRDYTLDRVVLNAAFRRAAHHQYARESYAYLKTKRQVSERRHIPYARSRHHYQNVSLSVYQPVSADDWKLYIGPNVRIDSITLVLTEKSRGYSRGNYRYTNYQDNQNYDNHDAHHWSEFANIRTRRENRRDKQLLIPYGANHVKLVGEERDTDILYAWVSFSDGRIQRLQSLQGTLRYGQAVTASIRRGKHQEIQATLHLVFKPHHRGRRSNLSVQSA